jgi:hypothetical protein
VKRQEEAMTKRALLWTAVLIAMTAAPAWAQSRLGGVAPRLPSADPKGGAVQGVAGITPRSPSADPTAAQQGLKGQTPRVESGKPATTTQTSTSRR